MAPHSMLDGVIGLAARVQVPATLHPSCIAFEHPIGRNRFGHRAPEVLERLEEAGALVRPTDECGHVEVVTDGEHLWVRGQAGAPACQSRQAGSRRRRLLRCGRRYILAVVEDKGIGVDQHALPLWPDS